VRRNCRTSVALQRFATAQVSSAVRGHLTHRFIALVGFIGLVIFGGVFVTSFVSPTTIEAFAREAIRFEIERKVQNKVSSLSNSSIADAAMKAIGKNSDEINKIKESLQKEVPNQVSKTIDKFLDPNCPCRSIFKAARQKGADLEIGKLSKINERLSGLVESKYVEVTASLMRELRIFSAANAVGFAALLLLLLSKPKAKYQLLLPAAVLLGSVFLAAYFYLFGQNWLHTLIFSEYVGYGYFAYLSVALVFFFDIAFCKCTITTNVFNLLAAIVGVAVCAIPC
jgi:hypothetical protein